MPTAETDEAPLLRARARGEIPADAGFDVLYSRYAPLVRAWLGLRAGSTFEDLAQDVWALFHDRWQRWEVRPEMLQPGARPVLSFLFQSARFVLKAHRRRAAAAPAPLDTMPAEPPDARESPGRRHEAIDAGRCLALARRVLREDELDLLLAKVAGLSAREIAVAMGLREAQVDHRYRAALRKLQARLRVAPRGGRRD
ncbi:MAG: hypothetical protein KJ067_09010 [Vicinamibacteria bacterium]|nr:hypothetical protein [Vicinamibacteria bacterium]